jgi:phytoene dehydrogenase-like protein
MTAEAPVVIVGAGLAGLACATTLHAQGVPVQILEASDGIGGRVRTDVVDGFLVDRGFQVLLTAYPEMHRQFDLDALHLHKFSPGALVWLNGRGHVVSDPFRDPLHTWSTATAPIGTLADKMRIAKMRASLRRGHPVRLLGGEDCSTAEALRQRGFSPRMIERFFRPLLGGIQLDPELATSRRMFDVIFRMLADGDATVPAAGMGAIPAQLAHRLPEAAIRLQTSVTSVAPGRVEAFDSVTGTTVRIAGQAVVVAAEGPAAASLLGLRSVGSKAVGSVWFAAPDPPTSTKLVVLDAGRTGPVLNVAVMSNVTRSYAPQGGHLIAASAPGYVDADLTEIARRQLRGWWGPQVDRWQHLRTHRILHGQPLLPPPMQPVRRVTAGEGMFVCGDHRDTASIQGALYSGRRCANAVLEHLGRTTDLEPQEHHD